MDICGVIVCNKNLILIVCGDFFWLEFFMFRRWVIIVLKLGFFGLVKYYYFFIVIVRNVDIKVFVFINIFIRKFIFI